MSLLAATGQQYDLLALRGAAPGSTQPLEQALFDPDGGQLCYGVQKLAQRWVLRFLTIRGSLPYLPNEGSSFMTAVLTGRLRTERDVQVAFHFARLDVDPGMVAEETADMPADERYAGAELLEVLVSFSGLELRVRIDSQAGDNRIISLPVTA